MTVGRPPHDDRASLGCVCLHEHAHQAVARAFGACGFVRIRSMYREDGPPCYAGAFQMHGELDERAWCVVALAGSIAEWIAECPSIDVDAIVARLACSPSPLSAVDADLAAGYREDDVLACVELLRTGWGALLRDAIEQAETTAAEFGYCAGGRM